MKTLVKLTLLSLLLSCGGCASNKISQEYAGKLSVIAKSYEKQVQNKMEAEEQSYKELGLAYDQALQDDTFESLWIERSERAQKLADSLLYGKRRILLPSQLTQELRGYANLDFDKVKEQLQQEQAAHVQLLSALEELQMQTASVDALSKSLDDLSTAKSAKERLKQGIEYGKSIKTELERLDCVDMQAQLRQLNEEEKTATGIRKDQVQKEITQLQTEIKNNNCQ